MQRWHWIFGLGLGLSAGAWAGEVKLDNAWARATAPGQTVGGVFMTLTADTDLVLTGASSAAADGVELHSMTLDKGTMVMRRMDRIDLPKGKRVELAPGGLHIMLVGIKAPLQVGDRVPLTLTVRDAKGKSQQVKVQAEVREVGGMMRGHGH